MEDGQFFHEKKPSSSRSLPTKFCGKDYQITSVSLYLSNLSPDLLRHQEKRQAGEAAYSLKRPTSAKSRQTIALNHTLRRTTQEACLANLG